MFARVSRITRRTLALSALGGLLFGGLAGYFIADGILKSAVAGALVGLLLGAACCGLHRGLRGLGLRGRLCCLLTIIGFGLGGPLVSGFITACAAAHPAGPDGRLAVIGFVSIGPLVLAIFTAWSEPITPAVTTD